MAQEESATTSQPSAMVTEGGTSSSVYADSSAPDSASSLPEETASAQTTEAAPRASTRNFKIYVDGQEITDPETLYTMPKTGLLNFTVVCDTEPDFTAGTGSVAGTRVSVPYNAQTKQAVYAVSADGEVGSGSGLYINGEKIFVIRIVEPSYTSSNYTRRTIAKGDSYTFTITSKNPNDSITFVTGNSAVLSTSVVNQQTANGQKVYTYRVTGLSAGTTGVYVIVNGVSYLTFDCTVTDDTTTTPSTPPSEETPVYGYINGSDVRLRAEPSLSATILSIMNRNTQVIVLDQSNPEWAKIQLSSGTVGYVYAEYLTLGTPSGSAATSISLSNSSGSVPAGKSFYVKASVTPSDSFVTWTSSNPSVATVENDNNYGYVLGRSPGTAVITATSGSVSAQMTITVTAAEPVRVTYASPNIVSANESVTLYAITDPSKTAVRFLMDGQTYPATSVETLTTDGVQTKLWSVSVSGLSAGTHTYTVQSTSGSAYQDGGSAQVWVSAQKSYTETTQETRRASDQIIQFIAEKEGYYASPYRDTLTADQLPTTGYGDVLYPGDTFYNHLSEQEALAGLIENINQNYMPAVNVLRSTQNLWMSQSQADALVSFAYNVGTRYFTSLSNECTFRDVMLNAVVPPSDLSATNPYAGSITNTAILYSGQKGTGTQLATLSAGTNVQIIGYTDETSYGVAHKDIWYQITANGQTGWVSSAYVHFADGYGLKRDLNYTNAQAMGTEFILWCYSNNVPIRGLYWRRLAEANIYNFDDYDAEAAKSNPYNYTVPAPFR